MAINVVLGEYEEAFAERFVEDNAVSWLLEDISYVSDLAADACPDLTKKMSKKQLKEALFNQNCQIQQILDIMTDLVEVVTDEREVPDPWTYDDEEGWSN